MQDGKIAEVVVLRPLDRSFEYRVPGEFRDDISVGTICFVPFGNTTARSIVLNLRSEPQYEGELQSISSLVYGLPLPLPLIELALKISELTLTPLGKVFSTFLPSAIQSTLSNPDYVTLGGSVNSLLDDIRGLRNRAPKQRELLEYMLSVDKPVEKGELLRAVNCSRSPLDALLVKGLLVEVPPSEVSEQPSSHDSLSLPLCKDVALDVPLPDKYRHIGIYADREKRIATYIQICSELAPEKSIMIIAPDVYRVHELGLVMEERLDLRSSIYHSGMTRGELSRTWREAISGDLDLLIGVKKALFCPLRELGGLIMEGETSSIYHSSRRPPYLDLVETGRIRAELEGIPIYSADRIPTVRSYYLSDTGKLDSVVPKETHHALDEGKVQVVDLADCSAEKAISDELSQRIQEALSRDQGSLLVGERKAFAQVVFCSECGKPLQCPTCQAPLVYQEASRALYCQNCGRAISLTECPKCGNSEFNFLGGGIEKARGELSDLFSEATVAFVSRDEMAPEEYLQCVGSFNRGEIDILLGTEISASVLFSDRLSVLGILSIDLRLNRTGYRSSEEVVSYLQRLLDKVPVASNIVLQTRYPDRPEIQAGSSPVLDPFFQKELESRKRLEYPPFTPLISIRMSNPNYENLIDSGKDMKQDILKRYPDWKVLGPSSAYPPKKGQEYRANLLVKVPELEESLKQLSVLLESYSDRDISIRPLY